MTIAKVVEIVVRAGSAGEAELLLIAMRGGERERDPDGRAKLFGIPLGRDDAELPSVSANWPGGRSTCPRKRSRPSGRPS
jgi:hypothetical protein